MEEILAEYGTDVEDIFDLGGGQKWMFEEGRVVKDAFFLQILFKAKIKLKASALRAQVDRVTGTRENLRSAFVYRNVSHPYRVVCKNRRAEMNFRDISDVPKEELDEKLKSIMEADRRRGFKLDTDPLIRISVLKTYQMDTYAIILSQPHINSDGVSVMHLLKDIFVDYSLDMMGIPTELQEQDFKEYAKHLEGVDKKAEAEYWIETYKGYEGNLEVPGILEDMGGEYRNEILLHMFDDELQEKLKKLPGKYKATINTVMQAAWSILLMKLHGLTDVSFGVITSGRDGEVTKSNQITGGFVNALPVRVKCDEDISVTELVSRIQVQFAQSMKNSHLSPGEIEQAVGRKKPLFDHLLNFHNFSGAGGFAKRAAVPGVSVLESTMYDNLASELTIYFIKKEEKYGMRFSYNESRFSKTRIAILTDIYVKIIEQICNANKSIKLSQIECPGMEAFDEAAKIEQNEKRQLYEFVRNLPIAKGLDESVVRELVNASEVKGYTEDETILLEGENPSGLYYVFAGNVALFKRDFSQWNTVLRVLKSGEIITVSGLDEEQKTYASAVAYGGDTQVICIPREKLNSLISRFPQLAVRVALETDNVAKRYAVLWINS